MSNPIRRLRRSPHIRNDFRVLTYGSLELLAEVGVGNAAGSLPQVALRWSDTDGRTWSNERWQTLGAIGKRKTRVVWQRLGQSESRIFEIVITDPVKVRLIDALLTVQE